MFRHFYTISCLFLVSAPICPYGDIMTKGDGSYELCKGIEKYVCGADSHCIDVGGYDYGACCKYWALCLCTAML